MLNYYRYTYRLSTTSSRWTPITTCTSLPSSSSSSSPPLLAVLSVPSNDSNNSSVYTTTTKTLRNCFSIGAGGAALKFGHTQQTVGRSSRCGARRRVVRYNDEDDDDEEEGEEEFECGHNAEIAMLELYSQSARDEVLLVRASVDDQEAQVLIFKGFSSCLSYKTSPDPSRSVLPARAVIKSIDRIRGPFDPSNIEYLEQGLTLEAFKTRLQ